MSDLSGRLSLSYDAKFHQDVNSSEPVIYRAWTYGKTCHDTFVNPPVNGGGGTDKTYATKIADKEEKANDEDESRSESGSDKESGSEDED